MPLIWQGGGAQVVIETWGTTNTDEVLLAHCSPTNNLLLCDPVPNRRLGTPGLDSTQGSGSTCWKEGSKEQQRMENPYQHLIFSHLSEALPYSWSPLTLEGFCNAEHIFSSLQSKTIKPVVFFVKFSKPQCNYLDAPAHANHNKQCLDLIRGIMCPATEKTCGFWAKDIKVTLHRKLLKGEGR